MKVCRLWRQIMTPILWETFDDDAMARSRIPADVIQAQSHHFRFVHITGTGAIPHPLHSRHVRRLVLANHDQLETFLDLILHNGSSLTTLEWHFPDSANTPLKKELIQYSLETLTKLESLLLSKWSHCSVGQLTRIGKNNPGLQKLILSSTKDLASTPGTHPSLNITELALDGQWEDNPGFVQLLRFCPKLESFKFWATSSIPAAAVSKNLRECSPKLTSIISLNENLPFAIGGSPGEYKVVHMIKAATGLVHFELPMDDLTFDITEKLLEMHANTLETIHLYLDGSNTEGLNINSILSSCPNLVTLAVDSEEAEWTPENAAELVTDSWNCPNLETLEVTGFNVIMSKEVRKASGAKLKVDKARKEESFKLFVTNLERHGWTVRSSYPPEEYRLLKSVVEEIMNRVFTMPQMKNVHFGNDFHCVRKDATGGEK
ncbi:hypothetical protein BG000_010376 [Podila horticola]|nr:hypothetical protein BG000_010376 [Podila horticola]